MLTQDRKELIERTLAQLPQVILRSDLGKRPAEYLAAAMRLRDPHQDTPETITLSPKAMALLEGRGTVANETVTPTVDNRSHDFGAGTELKKLLAKIGINSGPNCSCNSRAREMDRRGTVWCSNNLDTILGWLREEAEKQNKLFVQTVAKLIVKRAIRNARRGPLAFHLSATGLGDAVCGMYAAVGLAEATGQRVIYYAYSHHWLARASHPLVEVRLHQDVGPDANADYAGHIQGAATRKQYYCDSLASFFGIPSFKPVAPTIDAKHSPSEWDGYTVVSPFSAYRSREWPYWRELITKLRADGRRVVCIGASEHQDRLRTLCRGLDVRFMWGGSPADVTNMILGAVEVLGNDSGVVHLAGLLGVPTIAVHAGSLPHDFLFDLAPTIQSVTPGLQLVRSDHDTQALGMISPDVVVRRNSGRAAA